MSERLVCRFFFLFFFSTSIAVVHSRAWIKESFPHPVNNRDLCGRNGVKSWICDPDKILRDDETNTLEEMLQHVATNTHSDCPYDSDRPGYQIGIAVMRKMAVPSERSAEEMAREFARHLHNKWGVGHIGCDDGALLLISTQDRQIYISTGRKARETLSDDQIDIIIGKMKSTLREDEYGKALHMASELMHQVFSGKKLKGDGINFFALFCFILFFAVIVGSIVHSIYTNRQYENCKKKLERIERERNTAKNKRSYVSSSCPICLEDFTSQTRIKTLLCGHKYCESCLLKWLETNATCPICRQSTNARQDKDDRRSYEASTLDFLPELAFRLASLQQQYPGYVTADLINLWTSQQYSGSFVNDPQFCRARPFAPTGMGSHGSGSGFGGGSCDGGGGSGGSW